MYISSFRYLSFFFLIIAVSCSIFMKFLALHSWLNYLNIGICLYGITSSEIGVKNYKVFKNKPFQKGIHNFKHYCLEKVKWNFKFLILINVIFFKASNFENIIIFKNLYEFSLFEMYTYILRCLIFQLYSKIVFYNSTWTKISFLFQYLINCLPLSLLNFNAHCIFWNSISLIFH